MKIRIFPNENYKAIYFNGKTFRFALMKVSLLKNSSIQNFLMLILQINVLEIVNFVTWTAQKMENMQKM